MSDLSSVTRLEQSPLAHASSTSQRHSVPPISAFPAAAAAVPAPAPAPAPATRTRKNLAKNQKFTNSLATAIDGQQAAATPNPGAKGKGKGRKPRHKSSK
jgi:hypothetical protein